jgi:hypothetical protein
MPPKNDYTVVAFFDLEKPKKWSYVHKLNGFSMFLTKSHPNWKYFNVYSRRTGEYIKRFYRGAFIPEFLTFFFLTFSILTFNGFNNTVTIPTFF